MNRRVSFDPPLLVVRHSDSSKIACRVAVAHDCRRQYLGPSNRASSTGTVPKSATYLLIAVRGVRLRTGTGMLFGKPPRGRRVP
jgi:hypothetical protein